MTPEGLITKKIIAHLNARPHCHAHKVAASNVNRRGEPDIDACHLGRAVKLEVKRPGTEHAVTKAVSPIQAERLRQWADAGAIVGIVTSVADVCALLDCEPDDHDLTVRVRARLAALDVRSDA